MNDISLREHIEAMFEESRRALETAEVEREKAANVLRISLERSIEQGDSALRDHITNQVQQIKSSLEAQQRAADKFEASVKSQFATVNEFRRALDDLSKQMATRREVETAIANLDDMVEQARKERQNQIDDLRHTMDEMRSRLDTGPPQLAEIQRVIAATGGRTAGMEASRTGLYAAIAAVGAALGIIVVLANYLS